MKILMPRAKIVIKNRFFQQNRLQSRDAFTLIELLVVVSIIIALASIVVGVQRGVYRKQTVNKAKGELQVLGVALEQFKSKFYDYPYINSGPGSFDDSTAQELFKALTGQAKLVNKNGSIRMENIPSGQEGKPLVDVSKFTIAGSTGNEYFVDPWGQAYEYYYKPSGTSPTPGDPYKDWSSPQFILLSKGQNIKRSSEGLSRGTLPNDAKQYFEGDEDDKDNLVYNYEY